LKPVHPSIREVAVLQESTEMILSSMDVDTVLHQILLVVRNYFGTANAAVFLVDPATRDLYCRAHIGYSDAFTNSQIKLGPESITGRVAQNKMPVYLPDVRTDPKYIPADPKVRSELALPLLVREEAIGVLSIGSEKLDFFSDEMIGLLTLFAAQAAVALENARLYSTERRRMRQIELINLIARSAAAANDLEQLLGNLADLIEDTFDDAEIVILLRDREGKLALRAHAGKGEPQPENFAVAERSGILAEAFAARMNVVVNDISDRAQWPACFAGSGSELCIPLISFGETLGALVVAHSAPHFFAADDRSIAQAAADVCATAIRSVQLGEELRRITHTDSLTGLYNQRYFHVLAAEEIARSNRYHKQFSLLMIELKNFAQFNAKLGFEHGDTVLRKVAQSLKMLMRGVDSICRYGPDRFVLVLPETGAEQLHSVANKLNDALGKIRAEEKPTSPPIVSHYASATYPADGASELELVRVLLTRIAEDRGIPNGTSRSS
jgi:diguanylate cyclase (GGDEF)-like protein